MIHTLIHQFGVFVWKMWREGIVRDKLREKEKRRAGKEIRGRDCEPRKETYKLFLVASCVSHSETVMRRPAGRCWRRGDCDASL